MKVKRLSESKSKSKSKKKSESVNRLMSKSKVGGESVNRLKSKSNVEGESVKSLNVENASESVKHGIVKDKTVKNEGVICGTVLFDEASSGKCKVVTDGMENYVFDPGIFIMA